MSWFEHGTRLQLSAYAVIFAPHTDIGEDLLTIPQFDDDRWLDGICSFESFSLRKSVGSPLSLHKVPHVAQRAWLKVLIDSIKHRQQIIYRTREILRPHSGLSDAGHPSPMSPRMPLSVLPDHIRQVTQAFRLRSEFLFVYGSHRLVVVSIKNRRCKYLIRSNYRKHFIGTISHAPEIFNTRLPKQILFDVKTTAINLDLLGNLYDLLLTYSQRYKSSVTGNHCSSYSHDGTDKCLIAIQPEIQTIQSAIFCVICEDAFDVLGVTHAAIGRRPPPGDEESEKADYKAGGTGIHALSFGSARSFMAAQIEAGP
ncbi:hypothetical protein [Methylobacterium sp. A54F]